MPNPSAIEATVLSQFTELSPEQAKQVVLRALSWFTTLGVMFTKKVQFSEGADLESKAIAIALRSLFKLFGPTTEAGIESIDIIVSMFDEKNNLST